MSSGGAAEAAEEEDDEIRLANKELFGRCLWHFITILGCNIPSAFEAEDGDDKEIRLASKVENMLWNTHPGLLGCSSSVAATQLDSKNSGQDAGDDREGQEELKRLLRKEKGRVLAFQHLKKLLQATRKRN